MLGDIQIIELLDETQDALLDAERRLFSLSKDWLSLFPLSTALYAIYDSGVLVYIGETGNIRKRMSDLTRTVNHSFRRSLGYRLFGYRATSRTKFKPVDEMALNVYFEKNITIGFLELSFGRLEVEEYIVDKFQDQLMNKKTKRI